MDQHHLIFVSFIIHALLTMTMPVINQRGWQATVCAVPIYHAVSFLNIDPPSKPFTNCRPTNHAYHAFRFRGTVRLRVGVTVRVMAVKLANLH